MKTVRNAFYRQLAPLAGAYRSDRTAASRVRFPEYCRTQPVCSRALKSPGSRQMHLGRFMVREDFIGSESTDGIIHAHDNTRILLSEEESKKFLLGRYPDFYEAAGQKSWGPAEVK